MTSNSDVACSCHPTGGPPSLAPMTCSDARTYATMRAIDFGIAAIRFRSPERSRAMVAVRARVAKELRVFGYSLPEIGRALNRDHTTVINLLRIAERDASRQVTP